MQEETNSSNVDLEEDGKSELSRSAEKLGVTKNQRMKNNTVRPH